MSLLLKELLETNQSGSSSLDQSQREKFLQPKRSWNRFEYACWPSVHDVEIRIKKVVTSAHEIFVIPCSLLDIYGAVRSVYLLCAAEKDATVAYLVFVYKNLEQHVRFKFR